MALTAPEFCQFNLKSRVQLLEKDGVFLVSRKVYDKFIVKLYKLYKFLVEVVIQTQNQEIIKIEPVMNGEILELYHECF